VDICGLIIGVVETALNVAMTRTLDTFSMKNQRIMKMSECKYCGGDCPDQVDKNGDPRRGHVCEDYARLIRKVANDVDELFDIRDWDSYGCYKRSDGS